MRIQAIMPLPSAQTVYKEIGLEVPGIHYANASLSHWPCALSPLIPGRGWPKVLLDCVHETTQPVRLEEIDIVNPLETPRDVTLVQTNWQDVGFAVRAQCRLL